MNIGKRIRQRRKELKMSADELGALIGKNRATIFRYENGDIEKLPIDILKPIAEALKTTPQSLMGWEKVQEKNDTLADIVVRMRTDEDFFSLVEMLAKLDKHKAEGLRPLLAALVE